MKKNFKKVVVGIMIGLGLITGISDTVYAKSVIDATKWIERDYTSNSGEDAYQRGKKYRKNGNVFEAFFEFETAADQGNPKAAYELCWMYYEGIGTEKDIKKARQYAEKAARGDYVPAYSIYADMLIDCEGVNRYPKDKYEARASYVSEALMYLRAGANKNDPDCLVTLGGIYAGQIGYRYSPYPLEIELLVNTDKKKALSYYYAALNTDTALGYYEWGRLYFEGKLVPKNYREAERYLRKAYEMGARSNKYDKIHLHGSYGGGDIVYMLSTMYQKGGYGLEPQPDKYDHNHSRTLYI